MLELSEKFLDSEVSNITVPAVGMGDIAVKG
jgi:hypothetical protein